MEWTCLGPLVVRETELLCLLATGCQQVQQTRISENRHLAIRQNRAEMGFSADSLRTRRQFARPTVGRVRGLEKAVGVGPR